MKPFRLCYSMLIIAPFLCASFVSSKHVANEKYFLDTKESLVTWKGSMSLVPQNAHVGYLYISQGELTIEKGRLAGGTVEVDMNSITDKDHGSDNDLVAHLKSPDFFDVKKFPTAMFTITGVTSANDENINVTGDLTVKGIRLAITFPVKIEVKHGTVTANGRVIIDRTKWDVRYNSGKFFDNLADEAISDDIELDMKIIARKN
jgi:polyisoprenoid-binding protein YceI